MTVAEMILLAALLLRRSSPMASLRLGSRPRALHMMVKDVWMPKEYAAMKEGKIIRWFKWVGDKVSPSTSPS